MFKTFRSAVIAGFTIGLAGFGYLSMIGVLNGVVGAIVFAFGLLTIVAYKLKLFTGTAGFISMNKSEFGTLFLILIGNVIEQEFTQSYNWHAGSGLSLVLMIFIVISMALISKYDKDGEGTTF